MNNGKRHPFSLKQLARQLRQEGKTHREISKICGVSSGSAHLWTIGIILTKEQKEAIERRRNKPLMTLALKEQFRKNAKKYLKKTWDENTYSRKELLQKIINFYNREGRVPLKREFNMYRVYKNKFGSWNKAIKEAGFQPNEVIFSKKFTARDGHICDSFSEKIIDDWLSENAIAHERNVPYEGTKMSADFLVKDIRIEYFGLAGVNRKYDHLIEKKRFEVKKHNYRLVEIYPSALFASGFKEFFIRNLRQWLTV